jgi:gamma-glutamylcyclotransferase (GGCT)/AIG2-like uncharacterized protein YtfP
MEEIDVQDIEDSEDQLCDAISAPTRTELMRTNTQFSSNYQPVLEKQRFKVFVYGTLRKGFGNHALLENSGVKYICDASIRAKMYTIHWGYPFIVLSNSRSDRVIGEIYDVDYKTFQRLDQLEGYRPGVNDGLYTRKHATASGPIPSFVKHRVWVYEAGMYQQKSNGKTFIPSGNWVEAHSEYSKDSKDLFKHRVFGTSRIKSACSTTDQNFNVKFIK